jgi:hypothetical protein
MTTALPIGYVTILEAADILEPAMHAGVPDSLMVTKQRQEGHEVKDKKARDLAIGELWNAVDEGSLRSMAIGGSPRRVVRLDARFTRSVPTLRSPCGRGFTFLRPSNPAFHELRAAFGGSFHTATVAFRATEVQKLARRLLRARRTAQRTDGRKTTLGRPSLIASVERVIRDVLERRKWDATSTMKALTSEVNRAGKWQKAVSQDTVTRALDGLYEQTHDRRFKRVSNPRRPRSSGST